MKGRNRNGLVPLLVQWRTNLTDPEGLLRGTAWAASALVVQLALSLITSAIVARSLGAAGLGIVMVCLASASLFATLAGGGLNSANAVFLGNGRFTMRELSRNSMVVALSGAFVSLLAIAVAQETGVSEALVGATDPLVLVLVAASAFVTMLRQSFNSLLMGRSQMGSASRADIGYSIAYLALVAASAAAGISTVRVVLAANVGAATIAVLFAGSALLAAGASFVPRTSGRIFRATVGFGSRGSVGVALQFFTYRLDLFLISAWLGPAVAGYYGVASRLSELLWLLPGAVGTAVFSKVASGPEKARAVGVRAFWTSLWLCAAAAVGMVLTGWAVIPLMFSPAFAASYLPMALLLPGSALLGASAVLANELVARGFPGTVSLAALAAFLFTVILDLALIRAFGMAGAAVASSVAYAAYALAVIALYLGRAGVGAGPFLAAARAKWRVRLG